MNRDTISTLELQEMLNQQQKPFILDVRPADQRKEWRIAESLHLDAYEKLNQGDNTILDEIDIPAGVPVITVCAAGKTSLKASEALRRKGVDAYSLEGGMKAWNYAWSAAELSFPSGLKVIQVRRPAKGVLSYIAGSDSEAVVVDASLDPQIYLTLARQNGWSIKYAVDTHIHADYISRTRDLSQASGATHLFTDKAQVDFDFTPVASGDTVAFGQSTIQFIHTPGHTWESTTLRIGDDVIFTGDTLFVDSIGRPDLKASQDEAVEKAKSLYRSLKTLLALPSDMWVLPAHTSNSIPFDGKLIGDRLSYVIDKVNVMKKEEKEFLREVTARVPPAPPNYMTIATLNRKGSYDGYEPAELEAGGNHCAIS